MSIEEKSYLVSARAEVRKLLREHVRDPFTRHAIEIAMDHGERLAGALLEARRASCDCHGAPLLIQTSVYRISVCYHCLRVLVRERRAGASSPV